MDDKIDAGTSRPEHQAIAVGPRADQFGGIRLDRRHDDDDITNERGRNRARVERGSARLYIDLRRKLVDQPRFEQQRFQLRSDFLPLRIDGSREAGLQTAPAPAGKMRAQPSSQVDRFSDIESAALRVAEGVDAWRLRRARDNPRPCRGPRLAAIFDDQRLRDEAPREFGRSIGDAQHFGRERLIVGPRAHLAQSRMQSIAQEHRPRDPNTMNAMPSKAEGGANPGSSVEHKASAPRSVRCYVLTVSDTRTEATDRSGRAIAELLGTAGHSLAGRSIVRDDPALVRGTIERQLAHDDVQVIITTGGTGISSRDSTYEAVDALLEKRLDGFGELFRMLSFQEIGSSAMMSRATAGLSAGKIIVALPGSEAAVRLAMERLLLPELGHLVQQAGK